jgi:hypothetical protein
MLALDSRANAARQLWFHGREAQGRDMSEKQLKLFGGATTLPEGFRYEPDVITEHEERELLEQVRPLPFREFEFQGYVGKRRVVSFGWQYDFNERTLRKAEDIPAFLLSLREIAARFADMSPSQLQQVLVTGTTQELVLAGTEIKRCSAK